MSPHRLDKAYTALPAPVVYLDSQDYSRFGDVLRGKADENFETLFFELEERKMRGKAIFATSMPILAEILQYDPNFRETSLKKAEAVERLCGPWALAFPTRLIAAEIAETAKGLGLIPAETDTTILSNERFWFPDISNLFETMKEEMHDELEMKVAALGLTSRAMKRKVARAVRKFDPAKAAAEAAPQFAARFDLPVAAIRGSLVEYLRGGINAREGSRRFFATIGEPVKFVETYFEKIETDRSLPAWMRNLGETLQSHIAQFQRNMEPIVRVDGMRAGLVELIDNWSSQFGRAPLRAAEDDTVEFGVEPALREALFSNNGFVDAVPACQVCGKIISTYLRQVIGLSGNVAKIEASFGGDLIHAFYLPHVDLWRSDRRFSAVVTSALPAYAGRVVSKLTDLPSAIDAWHEREG
ncbi:hypothetical protein [Sphingopyxis terrae]|uniref:Uncharacterized protein n=1 Tax=Sphingopyxis terrae subsp. ummariensis TaxID=429001 RepID=A0A1Y6FNA6_9SPHN|nr:hypothetical protein [Sphingopyxis terrae]PCF90996.1 hypothetical protein CPA46_11085 [Sphingopyxis terrae subsp. ummariensis]SMQ76385.1 hypothetical protein SAMN06295984_1826 [Sphingopyxis terrae subsp. ummariensis]